MKIGEYYYCKFSGQILEFCGWFEENKTPLVKNPFRPSFCANKRKKSKTWKLSYLKPATEEQINNYKNELHNEHQFSEFYIQLYPDNTNYFFAKEENSGFEIKLEELPLIKEILSKGFIKKF